VLNIANAVHNSATQQAAQVLGMSDTQLAKEFTLGQIEGTKLANGIQNQSNVLSTTDKAINIFKQEGQQQLAEKVRWMVNSKSATAEIRLDPPDLGGINIKVNLSGDTAQVNFNVQSAAAKEALDQAVPRLRDMLQDQGIELGESVVQQESQNSQQGETSENRDSLAHGNNMGQNDTPEIVEDNTIQVMQQRVSGGVLGGIDYYA
jgi:flagellar hook-length control protein FliK